MQAGNTELADFYRQTLARPDFLPILDQWQAEIAAGQSPTPLTQDQDYLDALQDGYESEQQLAAAAADQAVSRPATTPARTS